MFPKGKRHVFGQGERAEQGAVLKQDAEAPSHFVELAGRQGKDVATAQQNAARAGWGQSQDDAQKCGFAASRFAQNGGYRPSGQTGGQIAENQTLAVAAVKMLDAYIPGIVGNRCHAGPQSRKEVST